MKEVWKNVPGYVGHYQVSDYGRVRSLMRFSPNGKNIVDRILKPSKGFGGYFTLSLCRNKRCKSKTVHRLVLLTFVGPCPKGMECCHSDGIRSNNKLNNLRWDTRSNNQFDSVKHGVHVDNRGENCKQAKLTWGQVKEIRKLYKTNIFTQQKLAKKYKVHRMQISRVVRNKTWKTDA